MEEKPRQCGLHPGQGNGTFRHTFSIPTGDQATGLSVVPGEPGASATGGVGLLDLLVGNGFGDVLHLEGEGDGTFQISGKRVSLSVVPDLLGPGQAGVLVGNQQDNRVTVRPDFRSVHSPSRRLPAQRHSWLRETSTGRCWAGGRPCPTRWWSAPAATPWWSTAPRPSTAVCPPSPGCAADLLRGHGPGQRHRGRHQRRRHLRTC